MTRLLAFLLLLGAVAPGIARAAAGDPSIAFLVETSAGSPALAARLEGVLAGQASRVVTASEVRAALQFLPIARPLDDDGAAILRRELGVDRVVVLSVKSGAAGALYVMARFVDGGGITRRFASSGAATFDDDVVRLLGEHPPPLVQGTPVPTATPIATTTVKATATPVPETVDVPARTFLLLDPPITPELLKTEVLVLGTNGSYYRGTVTRAADGALELLDTGHMRRFKAGEIKRLTIRKPARPPVVASERVIATRDTGAIEGTVVEVDAESMVLEIADGSAVRLKYSELHRIDVPASQRPLDIPDVQTLGVHPVAIYQPRPPYPAAARNRNLTGVVVVEVVVDISGRVVKATIVRSSPSFDDSALSTVRQWRYEPLVLDGRPTSWKSKINLQFKLRDGDIPRTREPAAPADGGDSQTPRFERAGAKEYGAGFGYVNGSSSYDIEGTESRVESADLLLQPFVGMYLADGFQLSFSPSWRHRVNLWSDDSTYRSDGYTLIAGAAYLMPLGDALRIGPQLRAGVYGSQIADKDETGSTLRVTERGRILNLGIVAKTPIGTSAIFTVELTWYQETFDLEYELGSANARGTGERTGFQTSVGFSWWRPSRRD